MVYSGGGSIADNATFTFNSAVDLPKRLELVLRNNGMNTNIYVDILAPYGGSCAIFSYNSSDEMVRIDFSFPNSTTMQVSGSIGLTSYDSWTLVKVYEITE